MKKKINVAIVLYQVKSLIFLGIKNVKIIAIAGVLGLLLGVGTAFFQKNTYSAYLSFLINENESTPINLSSLAGLAGIGSIGSGSVNEDKLMFLSTSRQIIGSALLRKFGSQTIADRFIKSYDLNKGFKKDSTLQSFSEFKNTSIDSLTFQENKALDIIIKFIADAKLLSIEGKKKAGLVAQNAGIVTVNFVSSDEELAKVFVENIYQVLSVYYVNKTIQRHLRNYNLIKHRADSIKEILSDKEFSGAAYLDQNLNLAKMTGKVKIERTRRDLEMLNIMYGEVLKNLEVAKFSLESQTPMLQVVDYPTLPLKVKRASKLIFGFFGFVLLSSVCFVFIIIKQQLNNETISNPL